jgi:hypothetical protein
MIDVVDVVDVMMETGFTTSSSIVVTLLDRLLLGVYNKMKRRGRRGINTIFIEMVLSRGDFLAINERDGVLFGVLFKPAFFDVTEDSDFNRSKSSSATGVLITLAAGVLTMSVLDLILTLTGVDKDLT